MAKGLFVTGTGTDVGKTYVTGLIVKKLAESGHNAAYYKAAMSGNRCGEDGRLIPGDAATVQQISGIRQPLQTMCPYIYKAAVSPHLASQWEGNPVRLDVVQQGFAAVAAEYEYVTVEGSGGILCPLSVEGEPLWLEDVVRALRLPSVIVASAELGTINSVVLTADYMRARGLPVKGIFFNQFHPGNRLEEDNLKMCEAKTGLPMLACIQEGDTELAIDPALLAGLYE